MSGPGNDLVRSFARHLERQGWRREETHISIVLLAEKEVFKIKKPVELGFLDFRRLEDRRKLCQAEVELNSRLAPEVYLGVVPLVRGDDGELSFGGAGEVVEYAVHMRRLGIASRADVLLAEGELEHQQLERVAQRLARFHREARCDDEVSRFGSTDAVATNVLENFRQCEPFIERYCPSAVSLEIKRWQLGFLEQQRELFERRIRQQRVRDGHGDLRLEHVYFDDPCGESDGVTVLDCIEFNDRFRYADVCCDVAFLAMDLSFAGRADLAEHFLGAYAQASNDYDLFALVDFYESYRAFVRAKIAVLTIAGGGVFSDADHRRRTAEARRFFRLAQASERRPLLSPRLLLVGGSIATGKSTVARRLARRLGAPVVGADRTRKHLLGRQPEEPLPDESFRGAYSPETTERVYAEVLRRAELVLRSGRRVVVDASFRARRHRLAALDLARRRAVPIDVLWCTAPREVVMERLRLRAEGPSVSDGRVEIVDDFVASFEGFSAEEEGLVTAVDTSEPWERTERRLISSLPFLDVEPAH